MLYLVLAIVSMGIAFRSVENLAFQNLMYLVQPTFQMPNAATVKNHILARCDNLRDKILMDRVSGSFASLTLDIWADRWKNAYLAVNAYYIDAKWRLRDALIGFEPLTKAHTGELLADILINLLKDFGIANHVKTITTDNASNNSRMTRALDDILRDLYASIDAPGHHLQAIVRLPCMSHVIQLALAQIFGALHISATNDVFKAVWEAETEEEELAVIKEKCNKGKFKGLERGIMIPWIITKVRPILQTLFIILK